DRTGLTKAGDPGNVQSAGTHSALMAAAVNDGRKLNPGPLAAHIQCAHTLGPVHLVRRDRNQVEILLDDVNWNLADRLGSIGVKDHAFLMTKLSDFRDRLQNANLVISSHDRDQDRFIVNGAL